MTKPRVRPIELTRSRRRLVTYQLHDPAAGLGDDVRRKRLEATQQPAELVVRQRAADSCETDQACPADPPDDRERARVEVGSFVRPLSDHYV